MAMISPGQLAQMRRQRTKSLQDTCSVTPSVPPGAATASFTVACSVRNRVTVGGGSGGVAGRHGGGGNQLSRGFDRSVVLPYGTEIKPGDRIQWLDETITVSEVDYPGSFGMVIRAHGARSS